MYIMWQFYLVSANKFNAHTSAHLSNSINNKLNAMLVTGDCTTAVCNVGYTFLLLRVFFSLCDHQASATIASMFLRLIVLNTVTIDIV